MSIEAVSWALNASVGDGLSKLILIALANHANHEYCCFPSRRTIAKYAECSLDTVDRRISILCHKGLVEKRERSRQSGDQTSNMYYLNVEPLTAATPAANSGYPAAELCGPMNRKLNRVGTEVPTPPTQPKPASSKHTKMQPLSLEQIKICEIFNRRESTKWSEKELKAFKQLDIEDMDDLDLIAAYYAAERAKGDDGIFRRDLYTFLNNYTGELDRAQAWKLANERGIKTTRTDKSGRVDRNAGTCNEGRAKSYKGFERLT